MTNTRTTSWRLSAAGAAGLLALLGVAGCRGDREDKPPRQFFPDMDDQPKWKPQEKSEFFTDGRTMRKPVTGTVPFGRSEFVSDEPWARELMVQRDDVLKEDAGFYTAMSEDGKEYLDKIPASVEVNQDLLKRGQNRFNIYCSVCHGYTGDGKGMVGEYFAVKPANFHDPKFTVPDPSAPDPITRDGYVFYVARNGVRSMPGYAHALTERDTWAVVAYIRALQASKTGSLQDVPEAQRPKVQQELNASEAAAAENPKGTPGTPGSTQPAAPPPDTSKPVTNPQPPVPPANTPGSTPASTPPAGGPK